MPDIWTRNPDIVLDILQKAGLECGVNPTILPEKENGIKRNPQNTCRLVYQGGYAELYIHKI